MVVNRTGICTVKDARGRLKIALAGIEAAELILTDGRDEFRSVAAQNAVLAGIAAADAICCCRLKMRYRGDDHRRASDLLRGATPAGRTNAATLAKLLDLKDEAQYGMIIVSSAKVKNAIRWAKLLAASAQAEIER